MVQPEGIWFKQRGGVEFVKQSAESAQRCRELASQWLAPAVPVG
jgi:hypothetical protein